MKAERLCSNCKKNPAAYTVQGEEGETCLCEECYARWAAAAEHVAEPDFFVSLFPPEQEEGASCPVCGTTLEEYSHTGLLGCAACYKTFARQLEPAIRRIHGRLEHRGKHPLGNGKLYELLVEQKRLRGELEKALREKRMQDAQRINRDIRDIRRMIGETGGQDG